MIRKQTTEIDTYSIDWAEVYEVIKTYVHNKYGLNFGEQNFQIRVVNETGVLVKPDSIRFKRTNELKEKTLRPKK